MASTNRNLKKMVEKRLFRQDLFYHLNILPITVPPLKERRNDIIPLVKYFLAEANKNYQLNKDFTNSAYHMLMEYNWPGNIREVKNVVERAVIMSDSDYISANELSLTNITPTSDDPIRDGIDLKEYLERIEFDYLNRTYEKFNSVRMAAAFLNMSKATFLRKRKLYAEKFGTTLTDDIND
jgi:transcriptional regulator with PAS, ATPase and Fis domain